MSTYFKQGFGLKQEVAPLIQERYKSLLIERMRQDGFQLSVPPFTFYLAEEFGFCYGVDKAIDFAFETRHKFPERRIFITNEIIHNPRVNTQLREMGIEFLDTQAKYADLKKEDVVLLPAFGAPVSQLEDLKKIGCVLVDTTCGSVVAVWKRVEKYAKNGFTSLIHGKYDHEETRATNSQALPYGGHYLVVKDMVETEEIAHFIETGEGTDVIREKYQHAASPGFDPERHLEKIGCANQTTMLSSESLAVAERIKQALVARYGDAQLKDRFMHFDTICSATQERQDAIMKLLAERPLDLVLVIGGFNSSNTSHLLELSEKKVSAYHISEAEDLISLAEIRCKALTEKTARVVSGWLPKEAKNIGVTAGASTPNRVIEDVITRFLKLNDLTLPS